MQLKFLKSAKTALEVIRNVFSVHVRIHLHIQIRENIYNIVFIPTRRLLMDTGDVHYPFYLRRRYIEEFSTK